MSKRWKLRELTEFGDSRGQMCVVEGERDIPFAVQRFFYDFHTTGSENRGNHANRRSQFAFISLAGSCRVTVDDGVEQEIFLLDDPHKLLWVDRMTWKTMWDFTKDNVLLVLSDCHYDSGEYIRDYDEFIRICRGDTK